MNKLSKILERFDPIRRPYIYIEMNIEYIYSGTQNVLMRPRPWTRCVSLTQEHNV